MGINKRKEIYDIIIEDIFQLYKSGIEIKAIDLWIILIDSNFNFKVLLVDVDHIEGKRNSLNVYLENLIYDFKLLFDKDIEYMESEFDYVIEELKKRFKI